MIKKLFLTLAVMLSFVSLNAKTLVAYYSYTNNVETIVNNLKTQIECDVVEIEPAEKGLDYAANNYALSTALLNAIRNNPDDASSYPAIDPVSVNMEDYETVIIACPLWWSQMAAPFQTFLFNYGPQMAGKNIGVIVSSASSGISGVVADAKRLIPEGNFLEPNLWIRSSQTSNSASMIEQWLEDIGYSNLATNEISVTEGQSVNLGLSIEWAGWNIGANAPEQLGGLYGWADPTGDLTSTNFDDYPAATPPTNICGSQYDIATAKWGGQWRMPTVEEANELAEKCEWKWIEYKSVPGILVTGPNGNSIFLPAAASRTGNEVSNQVGQRGCYWTGSLYPNNSNFAYYLYFWTNGHDGDRNTRRYIGHSVRAVNGATSGVEDIAMDNTTANRAYIYNLNGIMVSDNMSNINSLPKGIYIIKTNGKTSKIII